MQWLTGSRKGGRFRSSGNGDFDLYDVILNPVDDVFIDAHFIGKSVKCQTLFFCIVEDFHVSLWYFIPVSLVESPQIFSAGRLV